MNFIRFSPTYFERVWGGSGFKDLFGRIVEDKKIGESWEISDRPEASSVAVGGKFDKLSISEILAKDSEYILGKKWKGRFPVLVKWLDAQYPLSIQVHPCSETAKILNSESKNENWFIVNTKPNATIIAGLKNYNAEIEKQKISDKNWLLENLREINAQKGDSIFIQSGCIHSIGAGNIILEIQDNSDTTYRLYDWEEHRARQLHIKESLICANTAINVNIVKTDEKSIKSDEKLYNETLLCNSENFEIRFYRLNEGDTLNLDTGSAKIISSIDGILEDSNGDKIMPYENVLLPAKESSKLISRSCCQVLITTVKI